MEVFKIFKTFEIKQNEKVLSCDERLVIGNKFDNIITKLHFTFDEGISGLGGNKYVAMYNSDMNNGFEILPMLPDDSVLVSSNITRFPGKWKLVVLISYENISHQDITPDNVVYVSDELKCIVKDNFLTEVNGDEPPMDANIKAWYLEALKLKVQLDKYNDVIEKQYNHAVEEGYPGTKDEWFTDHFETNSNFENIMNEF